MEYELEPRYKKDVESRFKNLEKLHQSRTYTNRERKYQLPSPINHVDWRSPYDTLFVWTDNNQKVVTRGGKWLIRSARNQQSFYLCLGLAEPKTTGHVPLVSL